MRPGRGKQKGSSWERQVCRLLSLWLTNNERDDIFNRNVLSGGRFTLSGKGLPGDLAAGHPLAYEFLQHYSIECKAFKSADLDDFLLKWSPKSKMGKALEQTQRDAGEKRDFLLIVKQNYREPFVLTDTDGIQVPRYHRLLNRYHIFPLCDMLETKLVKEDGITYWRHPEWN